MDADRDRFFSDPTLPNFLDAFRRRRPGCGKVARVANGGGRLFVPGPLLEFLPRFVDGRRQLSIVDKLRDQFGEEAGGEVAGCLPVRDRGNLATDVERLISRSALPARSASRRRSPYCRPSPTASRSRGASALAGFPALCICKSRVTVAGSSAKRPRIAPNPARH
jgi:hypothetical protein